MNGQFVVIAQSPSIDVSQVIGPFRSQDNALLASNELECRGYNTEVCPLSKLAEVEDSPPWDFT